MKVKIFKFFLTFFSLFIVARSNPVYRNDLAFVKIGSYIYKLFKINNIYLLNFYIKIKNVSSIFFNFKQMKLITQEHISQKSILFPDFTEHSTF
jgi:hypothetical protein